MNHLPLRHCGLDPQSPLYIVVSGNLVKRVCEHKMANVVMTEGVGGLRVKPAMTDGWTGGLRVEPAMTPAMTELFRLIRVR